MQVLEEINPGNMVNKVKNLQKTKHLQNPEFEIFYQKQNHTWTDFSELKSKMPFIPVRNFKILLYASSHESSWHKELFEAILQILVYLVHALDQVFAHTVT